MLFELIATLCAGLFAGAAIYITFVEHPARLECGTELATTEFGPSYRRATLLQASLAALGFTAAVVAWIQGRGCSPWWAVFCWALSSRSRSWSDAPRGQRD